MANGDILIYCVLTFHDYYRGPRFIVPASSLSSNKHKSQFITSMKWSRLLIFQLTIPMLHRNIWKQLNSARCNSARRQSRLKMIPSACSRENLSCVVLVSRSLVISFWSNVLIEIGKSTILNKLPIFRKVFENQRTGKIVKNCMNIISSHFSWLRFEPLISKFTL